MLFKIRTPEGLSLGGFFLGYVAGGTFDVGTAAQLRVV